MKISHVSPHRPQFLKHKLDDKMAMANAPGSTGAGNATASEALLTSAINFSETRAVNTGKRLMQELNLNDRNRHRKSEADRILNLSEGTALFVALDRKTYKLSDPYVSNAEIRLAITKDLEEKHPGQKIRWVENAGIAEPGTGFWATVPIFHAHGATVVAGFGFSGGAILRYRSSRAVVLEKKERSIEDADLSLKSLPVDALGARDMEAGQEFEIAGQGKLRGDATIGVRYGVDVGLALAGIGSTEGVVATAAAEFGINVLSLNGDNMVRVTIRKIHQESAQLVSNNPVGLIIPPNKLFPGNWGAPQVGHGLLKYFAEHKGPPNFEAYLTDYTSLTLNCSLTQTHKHLHICSFDIDLTKPQAQDAYNALMRLDLGLANELAKSNDGVTKADLRETQNAHKAAVRLALCTEKLFLVEALKYESHGELIDGQGHHKIYRDCAYKKHAENWLTGHHDATWEVVEIKKDDEEAKTYYHFNYQKDDFFTRQSEIDTFFQFADALGIKRGKDTKDAVVDMPSYQKLLSHADDSKLNVDIYFTNAGVDHLRAANQEDFVRAFLQTRSLYDSDMLYHPYINPEQDIREGSKIYLFAYKRARSHRLHRHTMHNLKGFYYELCGRDLKKDYAALRKAERFAQLAQFLIDEEQNHDRIGRFFTALGKSHRPHYTQVIPTLTQLAGRDNVLVHTFSVSGGGVSLKSTDEGALLHPRNEMVKLCLRKYEKPSA